MEGRSQVFYKDKVVLKSRDSKGVFFQEDHSERERCHMVKRVVESEEGGRTALCFVLGCQ